MSSSRARRAQPPARTGAERSNREPGEAERSWYADRTGARYVFVKLANGKRKISLSTCTSDDEATRRAVVVRELARALREGEPRRAHREDRARGCDGSRRRGRGASPAGRGAAQGDDP